MAKGISLHIGLNQVDPNHYQGWSGPLNACLAVAEDMEQIAIHSGFQARTLMDSAAGREALISAMKQAAGALTAGDIFFLSFSGHGGQVPDLTQEEEDGLDETWCLYDGQIIDDELNSLFGLFGAGVRILVVSDSCHSGTATRGAITLASSEVPGLGEGGEAIAYRYMPLPVALRTYRAHRSFYDGIAHGLPDRPSPPRATVRLLSGCQDNQYSLDGVFNGRFTATLLSVWNEGRFKGSYADFHKRIVVQMPATQTPNHLVIGGHIPEFDTQRPFQVG
jgi:hypothetical protein